MEKIYKTMRNTGAASIAVGVIVASVGLAAGACSIAVGVIILVTGVTVGIMSIVCGGLLLKRKGEITF